MIACTNEFNCNCCSTTLHPGYAEVIRGCQFNDDPFSFFESENQTDLEDPISGETLKPGCLLTVVDVYGTSKNYHQTCYCDQDK